MRGSFDLRALVIPFLAVFLGLIGCQRPIDPSPQVSVRPFAAPVTPTALPSAPADREARGRRIYQEGTNTSGQPITAVLGGGSEVPASLVACANCHGRDGRGVAEGNLIPPDLKWSDLTKPYQTARRDGRPRPPYTDALITRAITLGVDSAGTPLTAAMPRYRLSLDDCADLLAYLKRLGHDAEPGITDAELRLGVILPPDAGGLGDALRGVLSAYFETLNRRGGVYHRRIAARFVALPRAEEERAGALESFLNADAPVFALISIDLVGIDPTPALLAERLRIPLIAVTSTPTAKRSALGRWAFSLLAGPDDQALALARVALADASADAPFAIVHGADAAQVALARATVDRFRRARLGTLTIEVGDAGEAATVLRGAAAIVLLGPPGRMKTWLSALADRGKTPPVIIPGALADRDLVDAPRTLDNRIALALAIDPSDQTVEGLATYRALAEAFGLVDRHRPAQFAALAAADLLVEALKRAGRDLHRDRLVGALEGIRDFRTGLAPPLTFGPNRRVGAPGAHVVAVDLSAHRLVPTGRWLDADPPALRPR
jgi:ABC-type branched-subunit amino acid transport system substrate-binding protein/mono/diheme cytochrome c family protein